MISKRDKHNHMNRNHARIKRKTVDKQLKACQLKRKKKKDTDNIHKPPDCAMYTHVHIWKRFPTMANHDEKKTVRFSTRFFTWMEGAVDHPQRYRGGPQHPLIHKQQRMSPWYGTGIPMLPQRRQYHEWDNLKDGTIPLWDNLMGQSPHNGTTPTMTLINHHDISSNGTTCSSTKHVNRHGNYAHYSQTRVRSFFKIKWSGKTKKWHIFAPPSKKEVYPNHQPWKNHQKSALVQIPPANTVFRENIIHISTDQGRAKPWPMEKIYSQRTMFKSSKEINIKKIITKWTKMRVLQRINMHIWPLLGQKGLR